MEFDDGEPGPVLDGIPFADDETAKPAGSKSGADSRPPPERLRRQRKTQRHR